MADVKKQQKFGRGTRSPSAKSYKAGNRRVVNKARRMLATLRKQPNNDVLKNDIKRLWQDDVISCKQGARNGGYSELLQEVVS